jgi:hypothetical protein
VPGWLDQVIAVRSPSEQERRRKPVSWLSVPQLLHTSLEVAQATSFAKYADRREAMASSPREFYQLLTTVRTRSGDVLEVPAAADATVWVDYVADTGDGFDATYATARCLAGGVALGPEGRPPQADLLVLGGDEVYPVASAAEYESRLTSVLRRASHRAGVTHRPPVLALPGNHDWYDGLAAFRRVFCESRLRRDGASDVEDHPDAPLTRVQKAGRDDVGGWGAFQSRSYFAVQLTPTWWLWAVDSQLDGPLDVEQMSYFRSVAHRVIDDDASVVLCSATPSWLEAGGHAPYTAEADTPFYTLLYFVDRTLGGAESHRIRLVLTGDQHHYSRYVPAPGGPPSPELVTCGGGGAFLASTHHLPDELAFDPAPWQRGAAPDGADVEPRRYALDRRYPTRGESYRLSVAGLVPALWRNGFSLPALLGAANLPLFAALLLHPGRWQTAWQFWVSLGAMAALLFAYALSGAKGATRIRPLRRGAAAVLAALHTAGQLLITSWVVAWLSGWWARPAADRLRWLVPPPSGPVGEAVQHVLGTVAFWLVAAAGLGVLGLVVFLLYLRVADLVRCHTVEAFSALQITGYKSHLRLAVSPEAVAVHVVAMDRVPRAWRWRPLADVAAPEAYLLDAFVVPRTVAAPAPAEPAPSARAE